MAKPALLIVDDDLNLLDVLGSAFRARGFEVVTAADGRSALEALEDHPPDVMVLDLGLPDLDGLDVCRLARRLAPVRVVVLSADGAEERKIAALDQGADDYLTKPFSTGELLARVNVAVRHRREFDAVHDSAVVRAGDLVLDADGHLASVGPAMLDLTHKEFQLLLMLARNAGRLLSHGRLLERAWDGKASVNALRIQMSGLRRKLDESGSTVHIESEPGVGYRLVFGSSAP